MTLESVCGTHAVAGLQFKLEFSRGCLAHTHTHPVRHSTARGTNKHRSVA